jgi:DNA helicase IV
VALDYHQRLAVIRDEKHNLVVAAAGSGKTSVLTYRIAYLTRKKKPVKPERILALAFNKDAAAEMKVRLTQNFAIESVMVKTFHAFAYEVIKEHIGAFPYEIVDVDKEVALLFEDYSEHNPTFQQLYLTYVESFLEPKLDAKSFETKQAFFNYIKSQKYMTLNGIEVKSKGEKEIANFLYKHNIAFEYEKKADWAIYPNMKRGYRPDFYLPQYDVYIEHWGTDRNGNVPEWFAGGSYMYQRKIEWARNIFASHDKKLIETWNYEIEEGNLIELLQDKLKQQQPELLFTPLSYSVLLKKVYALHHDINREIQKLIITTINQAICHFITPSDLHYRLETQDFAEKSIHFGTMAHMIYNAYIEALG